MTGPGPRGAATCSDGVSRRTLTIDQACGVYNLSRSTLHRLRRDAGFPSVQIGRKVLIPVPSADRWFDEMSAAGKAVA